MKQFPWPTQVRTQRKVAPPKKNGVFPTIWGQHLHNCKSFLGTNLLESSKGRDFGGSKGVKEPRHSETIFAKKRYTSIVACVCYDRGSSTLWPFFFFQIAKLLNPQNIGMLSILSSFSQVLLSVKNGFGSPGHRVCSFGFSLKNQLFGGEVRRRPIQQKKKSFLRKNINIRMHFCRGAMCPPTK